MALKLLAGALAFVVMAILLQGWIFGSSKDDSPGPLSRLSAIPTATLPASLPEPILLGESQSASRAPAGGTTSAGSASSYTVKTGDTLGAIASSQGVAPDQQAAWVAEVLRLNAMDDARQLRAGQELQLPRLPTQAARPTTPAGTTTAGTPAAGATAARTSTPSAGSTNTTTTSATATTTPTPRPNTTPVAGGGGTYTVQSGDFPLAIAGKLGVPAAQQLAWSEQLISLNNLNPNSMTVGQVLQLPAGTPGR